MKWLLIITLAWSAPLWAHDDGNEESLVSMMALYQRMANLTPEELDEHSITTPSVRIAGQKVYLNGAFWELTRQWIRFYYDELQRECQSCIKMTPEMFEQAAIDHIGRQPLEQKLHVLTDAALEHVEHMAVGGADAGARLGKFAAAMKAAGEAVEEVVTWLTPAPSVHLLCSVIDAYILFGTRPLQSAWRSYNWAPVFERGKMRSFIQAAFVGRIVKKAQKKVRFTVEPVEVNQEMLREVDLEGPNRWWGFVKKGKRAKWVDRLVKRSQNTVKQREFLGGRMKRYLFLKGRKRGHGQFMRGSNEMDKVLNTNVLWILELQESVLERSLIALGQEPAVAEESLALQRTPQNDEIRAALAAELGQNADQTAFIESLMRDIEVVFDPKVPMRIRYFHAAALENILGSFVYGMYSKVAGEKGEAYGHSPKGIWNQVRMHWRVGRFGSYIFEWADFLRLAALQKNEDVLFQYKYEAMESFLKIMGYVQKTTALIEVNERNLTELRAVEDLLGAESLKLRTFRPWVEKKVAINWIPFLHPKPRCEKMEEAK